MMPHDEMKARARKAVGPERPTYFNLGDVDRVMAILLALTSEVAAIRDRLDSHERIAEAGALPTAAAVEDYVPADDVEQTREAWRDAYIRRLFRVVTEDIEALRQQSDEAQAQS